MSEHITVRGFVATDPALRNAQAGFPVGNFRLAATDRRFDREQNAWVDGATNWFTVNAFRGLAQNMASSLRKGQPVVVTGRLKVRPWQTEDRSGTAVEIEADSIGHDLALGTATFQRSSARVGEPSPAEPTAPDTSADQPAPSGYGTEGEPGDAAAPHTVNRDTGEITEASEEAAASDYRDAALATA